LGPRELGVSRDDDTTIGLEQATDAACELLDDRALPLDELGHVDLGAAHFDTDVRSMVELLKHRTGVDERLGGDAAHIEADAPELAALDHGHLFSELG